MATATREAALIERTLERIAGAVGDITPQVYEAFFAVHPQTRELFGGAFTMARGHMLNEVFMTLIDQANGKPYVGVLIEGTVRDHDSKGVGDLVFYRDFLAAMQRAIGEALGDDWPEDERTTFNQQCRLMLANLIEADAAMHRERKTRRR